MTNPPEERRPDPYGPPGENDIPSPPDSAVTDPAYGGQQYGSGQQGQQGQQYGGGSQQQYGQGEQSGQAQQYGGGDQYGQQYGGSYGQGQPQYGQGQYGQGQSQYGQGQPQYDQPQYGAPGYGAPQYGGGYGDPDYGRPKRNGLGIAALVCGVLSLPGLLLVIVPGLVLGIAAIVLGIMGRKRAKRGEASNGGMALAGLVLGVIGTLLALVLGGFAIYGIATVSNSPQGQDYQRCVQEAGSNQAAVQRCAERFQQDLQRR